ncbi:hypothetical protein IPP75_06065 [Candidatus Saccharibacteria bacterium]|nr:MAG: hypothetical protein IPP75_06065 [Candidatus Saccharibacteria bacterium]
MSLAYIREDLTPSDEPVFRVIYPDGTTVEYGGKPIGKVHESEILTTESIHREFGCLALEIPMEHRGVNTDIQDPYTRALQASEWIGIHFKGGREDIRRIATDALSVCAFIQTLGHNAPPYVVGITHQDAARMAGRFGMRLHEVVMIEELAFDDLEFVFECARETNRPDKPIPPLELWAASLPTEEFIRLVTNRFGNRTQTR